MDLQRASEIIKRARSIAELPNSANVTHADEIHSLNEAWKDIYAALKDSDDDYYVTEVTYTISSTYAVAGSTNEYLIPLPADFAQIRYLDYKGPHGDWWPVKKFPLSMKDHNPGEPYYRLKGDYLWIIGSNATSLRMGYYPPPALITLPQPAYYYGTSYTPPNKRALTVPAWASYNRTMIYMGASYGIKAESQTLSTVSAPVALFTDSGTVTNLQYYQGTLFWIRGGGVFSKDTDLSAAFTGPTTVLATTVGVVAFHIVDATIYYATATEIKSCTLAGGSASVISTTAASSLCKAGAVIYYVASGALKSLSPAATVVASGVTKVTTDGTYLYTLGTDYVVNRLTVNATPALTATDQLATDVGDIGHAVYDDSNEVSAIGQLAVPAPSVWVIPMLTRAQLKMLALDATVDYDFSYPNNLVPEIMAHQAAVDFRAKGEKDTEKLAARLAALWERFRSSIKRDEFAPARINSAYGSRWGWY
jgi:hypothetical protein